MENTKWDFWVGLFVISAFIALFVIALKASNFNMVEITKGYTVTANFENIGGLKLKSPIKSAGVVVGRVENISLDNRTHEAVVKLKIDGQYLFPKDTFVNIYTMGLLGEQYLGLEAGGEIVNWKDGDKAQHTQDAVVLERIISKLLFSKASEAQSE